MNPMTRNMLWAIATAALITAGLTGARSTLAQEKAGPRTIELPQVPPNLPDAPGKSAVESGCVICHSTRYITMQPAFGREVWVASVDKMRKTFGAPITNEQAATIVDYLVAIRGTKSSKP
jgi:cytochrome c5